MNPHQAYPTSLFALVRSLRINLRLIVELSRREVVGRYRGSFMGLAWAFFNPVLMLTVYSLVFGGVFKSRWGVGSQDGIANFAVTLFVGMIIHGLFAECVNRAPAIVVQNPNYVKKVVFPLEVLSWVVIMSALFHAGISLLVLLVANLLLNGALPPTAPLVLIVVAPLVIATAGVCWILASLGVYVRDIGQATGVITAIMLFMAPVFYPSSAFPGKYRFLLSLNPLTIPIEESRKVLLMGVMPDWFGLLIYALVSVIVACVGFWWFQRTRKGFADVI